jgi:hypothetical protein
MGKLVFCAGQPPGAAMQYQHPELEIVRPALDQKTAVEKQA